MKVSTKQVPVEPRFTVTIELDHDEAQGLFETLSYCPGDVLRTEARYVWDEMAKLGLKAHR